MKIRLILISIFLLLISLKSGLGMNNIYIDESWSAGKIQEIKIETDIDYTQSHINIIDSQDYIIYDGKMEKPLDSTFTHKQFIPSNQKDDTFTINIILSKQYYQSYEKTFEIEVIKLTLFQKAWLFMKTHLPFIK